VFGQDGNFSREALITRYNADLANGLGNLASRTLTMIGNYSDRVIPKTAGGPEAQTSAETDLFAQFAEPELRSVSLAYSNFNFSRALELLWALVAAVDRYLVLEKPWVLANDSRRHVHLERVLYNAADSIRTIVVLAHPAIPESAQKIWRYLGESEALESVNIQAIGRGQLRSGLTIGNLEAVFPRVDKKEAMERIEAMEQELRNPGSVQPATAATTASGGSAASAPAPADSAAAVVPGVAKIGIDDFAKVEMRVGQVRSAEKVAGADKLLKVMVDLGDEVRQIVAGIATAYQPEELVGRKVVIVANLLPRKLRGVESNGMLLAASTAEGKPVLCTFAEEVPVGARLK
jgi:methionyl-tRNA synthetase